LPFGETLAEQKATGVLYNNVYKFTGKELDSETGLYYLGARYYSPVDGIFLSTDPLAGSFPSWGPYVYTLNNPVRLTDPTGMAPEGGESTIVEDLGDGKYKVIGGDPNDGDNGIYVGSKSGERIGESLTTHSFIYDDGTAIKGAIIDTRDNSGQEFFDNEINGGDMWVWSYMPFATGRKVYDFKKRGVDNRPKGMTVNQYAYRGMPFQGKYASARDVGNYAAGAVAGANGFDWGTARMALDGLEKVQNKNIFSTEALPTQLAQKQGHNLTYPKYIEREYKRLMDNPMYKTPQKW
jgi:RHS repeat-associated protein